MIVHVLRRVTVVAVPVLLVAAVLAVVLRDHGDGAAGPEQARVAVVEGEVRITGVDGARTVTDSATLAFGDTVEVTRGSARLDLADGATYELRHRDGGGSIVVVGAPPELLAGDALLVDGFPTQIRAGTATLSAQGPARVDADESLASAYAGRVGVAGVGDISELRMLHSLVLVPGAAPEPMTFDGGDEWDRRYLGEAIAFGERLEALARGYTSDLSPGGGRSVGFFEGVVPALGAEREFGADLLDPGRSAGETLVGAAIVVQGRRDTFRSRWQEVFAFRSAGAAWGLVALDQGVSSAPVLETIELAIAGPVPAGSTSTEDQSTTTTTAPRAAGTTTSTTTTTTSPPSPPSPPPPTGGPLDPLLDPLLDPVGDLLDRLLRLLLDPG